MTMWPWARALYLPLLAYRHHRPLRVVLLIVAACWSVFAILVMRRYFNLGSVPEDGFVGIEFVYFGLPRWILCYLPGIVLLFTILTGWHSHEPWKSAPNVSTMGVVVRTTVLLLPMFGALGIKGWQVWQPYRDQQIRDDWNAVGADPSITWGSGTVIGVSYRDVKGKRLAPLASTTSLQTLICEEALIVDDDLIHIRNLLHLISLRLDGTRITDKGLQHIGECHALRSLVLSRTQITGEGLASLASLSTLERLSLDNTAITDEGLKALQSLASLDTLHLEGTKISDNGLQVLSEFRHLRSLRLKGCNVSVEAIEELQESLPDCLIYFPGYKTRPRKRPMPDNGPPSSD